MLQQQLGINLIQSGLLLSLVQGAGMCFALLIGSYTQRLGFIRLYIMLGLALLVSWRVQWVALRRSVSLLLDFTGH